MPVLLVYTRSRWNGSKLAYNIAEVEIVSVVAPVGIQSPPLRKCQPGFDCNHPIRLADLCVVVGPLERRLNRRLRLFVSSREMAMVAKALDLSCCRN